MSRKKPCRRCLLTAAAVVLAVVALRKVVR